MFKNFLIFILILKFKISLTNNDEICRIYENKKYLEFKFDNFKKTFHSNYQNNDESIYYEKIEYSKMINNRFKKFNMLDKGRTPIFNYCKELIFNREQQLLKTNPQLKSKIIKFKKLINKTIEFLENFLLIYTKPFENFEFKVNDENLYFYQLRNILSRNDSIIAKKFDYFLFIDFENNKDENYTAFNIPQFSFLKYHSRPVFGYLLINLYYLKEGEIRYEEIMTCVHEIMHSFGLVDKEQIIKTMNKLDKINKNNEIKKYIQSNNDFYKLYTYLKYNNQLEKIFKKGDHFNPNYLYSDIMQPSKIYVKHFTYISAGLFEILTNYEIRINKKLLKRNYNSCLPILKELFKNNCENSNGNYIKSFKTNKTIQLNNKCSKKDDIVNNFCDQSFQYKRYCNYELNSSQNSLCYKSITDKKSNCFDQTNNNNEFSLFDQENIIQFYGKTSNCFHIKKYDNNINPVCFKNNIDLKNLRIEILINEENGNQIKLYCKYIKKLDKSTNQYTYQKKQDSINFIYNYYYEYKLYCPDMNQFYNNNISNLCDNDCNLNGRCIGYNKCECFHGYDSNTNCKTLKTDYVKNINKNDYIFKGDDFNNNIHDFNFDIDNYYKNLLNKSDNGNNVNDNNNDDEDDGDFTFDDFDFEKNQNIKKNNNLTTKTKKDKKNFNNLFEYFKKFIKYHDKENNYFKKIKKYYKWFREISNRNNKIKNRFSLKKKLYIRKFRKID